MLTIVMYHYVRDLANTEYPQIKGLVTADFDGQLDYIENHYTVIDIKDVARVALEGGNLPPKACLLTFDDGLVDHYETVFSRLLARGLTGSFYPSACSVTEGVVLDVHKLQFIIASGHAPAAIKERIFEEIEPFRKDVELPSNEDLFSKNAIANRYAEPDVAFIKNLLQKGLPEEMRSLITSRLFIRFVTNDEVSFARKLYMNIPQMREMVRAGMVVGGHGYRHHWLSVLSREEQEREINATLQFMETIYSYTPQNWIMCYPYGDYNDVTLSILKAQGAALGLTNKFDLVSNLSQPLELERLDTIDLPRDRNAPLSEWTLRA